MIRYLVVLLAQGTILFVIIAALLVFALATLAERLPR